MMYRRKEVSDRFLDMINGAIQYPCYLSHDNVTLGLVLNVGVGGHWEELV